MTSPIAPEKLLRALIEKGTHTPLSESELATAYALIETRGDKQNSADTPSHTSHPSKDAMRRALDAEREKSAALQDTIDTLYNSTSWKLSAPIRFVKNLVTGHPSAKIAPRATSNRDMPPPAKAYEPSLAIAAPQYVPRKDIDLPDTLPASLYAFYLPQFHPIAQNDAWWGEGFTEWTNVRPATPQFDGHIQPHIPDPDAGLGYYDLTDPDVMARQIKLANAYGVEGFCFYFYWFAGTRLLETPLLNLLDNPDLKVPFCLCWANENWSRRWDGRDDDVLIAQDHSAADDIAFIEYIAKYLRDPRYRRIDGKPILLVYRPSEMSEPLATTARWRIWCRENGIGEIYLAYTQSFEASDPRDHGFDGAVEFPPNNSAPPDVTDRVETHEGFGGKIYDWDIFPRRSERLKTPAYPIFRSVCPAWDNTARRKTGGTIFINSTPARYQTWLENVLIDTVKRIYPPGDRLVFINAWNEWAEGAHLEPDAANGYAYLDATRAALLAVPSRAEDLVAKPHSQSRIALVSHDAHPMGAQFLIKNMAQTLGASLGYDVDLVTLDGGPILDDFASVATLHNLDGADPAGPRARALASYLSERCDIAICNTTASGLFAATLRKAGLTVISLVHELPDIILRHGLERHADALAAHSSRVIFPAPMVARAFEGFTGPLGDKAVIRPQGAYKRNRFQSESSRQAASSALRSKLGLAHNARIVLGVGYGDHRKGFDLFLDASEALGAAQSHIVFLWLGHLDPDTQSTEQSRIDRLIASGALILPGRVKDTDPYYAAADVFALTSREDPYPSTVLEALDMGLPTIGFAGATGTVDLISEHGGHIVPRCDSKALIAGLKRVLLTTDAANRTTISAKFRARDDISFHSYVRDLLALFGEGGAPTITAIVPNFNYADYLPARIASIVHQTLPVSDIIILDDASSDNSRSVMSTLLAHNDVQMRCIENEKNSGSVFAQWLRGVEAASGDYVWIAEADDLADPEFLAVAMAGFETPNVVMSYTGSRQIDGHGRVIDGDYNVYQSSIDPVQWQAAYTRAGVDEIAHGLSVKNTVPNVSGVVFHRETLLSVLSGNIDAITAYRVAGDWRVYVDLLMRGDIAFDPRPLNDHRRHDASVTLAKFGQAELREIEQMQAYVASQVDVPASMRAKARAYLSELRAQFGLPE